MGFIDHFSDIMDMETGFLQYAMALLKREYAADAAHLGIEIPDVSRIPAVRFDEAKRLAAERYGYRIRDPTTWSPRRRCTSAGTPRRSGAATSYSSPTTPAKAALYAMDDPADPRYTLSFDLLFRGMEVTTGGQRIHDYRQQVDKMLARDMHPEEFESYLMIHSTACLPTEASAWGWSGSPPGCAAWKMRPPALFPRDQGQAGTIRRRSP